MYRAKEIPWLPGIPSSWPVQPAKTVLKREKILNSDRTEQTVLSLTLRGVVENDPDNPEGLVPSDYATYQIFEADDLVFKLIDLENVRTSRVGHVHRKGIMSSAYLRLRPMRGVCPRYLYWQFFDLYNRRVFNQLGNGVRSTLGAEDVLNLPLAIPTLPEQQAIADYLDREIARIDKLIEVVQHRLETATERLVSAIELAVLGREPTPCSGKAAGPLVPVPGSWSMRPNKSFLRERSELSSSGTEELLSVSHLTGVTRRSEKNVTMFLAESNEGYKLVRSGDLVINTMWAWMGALGVSELEGIVSPAYGVYEFTDPEVDSRYFDALFRSPAYVCEMTRFSKGVWKSRLRLYPESFLSLRTPFPPVEQQRRIADQVREPSQEADRLLSLMEKELGLLDERRNVLITAVMSGELGVAA